MGFFYSNIQMQRVTEMIMCGCEKIQFYCLIERHIFFSSSFVTIYNAQSANAINKWMLRALQNIKYHLIICIFVMLNLGLRFVGG